MQASDHLRQLGDNIAMGEARSDWAVNDGLIFFRGKVYLLATSPLGQTILSGIHDMAHEGIQKILQRVKGDFF